MYWKYRKTRISNVTRKGRSNGRPKGTYKRFQFKDTKIGCLLQLESPILYNVIISTGNSFYAPKPELIEHLVRTVMPQLLETNKFKKAMAIYRELGIYCRDASKITDAQRRIYAKKKEKELKAYIRRNFEKINMLRLIEREKHSLSKKIFQ